MWPGVERVESHLEIEEDEETKGISIG